MLSEDAILKWHSDGKGKGVLLEQLKPFVEWLKHAEEGNYTFMLHVAFTLLFLCLCIILKASLLASDCVVDKHENREVK